MTDSIWKQDWRLSDENFFCSDEQDLQSFTALLNIYYSYLCLDLEFSNPPVKRGKLYLLKHTCFKGQGRVNKKSEKEKKKREGPLSSLLDQT